MFKYSSKELGKKEESLHVGVHVHREKAECIAVLVYSCIKAGLPLAVHAAIELVPFGLTICTLYKYYIVYLGQTAQGTI